LRDDATKPERWLWSRLRELRQHGFHFRRQVPFRGYFLDFAEHRLKLVIELDGGQHGEDRHLSHDQRRDELLVQEGYRVLRIPNNELIEDFEQVLAFIVAEAERRLPPTRIASLSDLPTRGRLKNSSFPTSPLTPTPLCRM
jgi:very-short-patch-repair endonuclease